MTKKYVLKQQYNRFGYVINMSSRAKINPDIMKWARIEAGYNKENLPKRFQDKFEKWEDGSVNPTWNQLRDLSNSIKDLQHFSLGLKHHLKIKWILLNIEDQTLL